MSGSILQSGAITPGHAAMWLDNGTVRDAGPASGGALTQVGVTNDGGQGLGINSGSVFGPYTGFGVTVAADGTIQITAAGFNGGAAANLEYVINGVTYSVIGSLPSGAVLTLQTIAQLRALTLPIPVPTYNVEGYYAVGDGGGGLFNWVPSDTTSQDNGGTIIVDADGRRWYRDTAGLPGLAISWFGAKADGATDIGPAVNAAIAVLAAQGGGNVFYGSGNFAQATTVSITTSNISLIGNGGGGWHDASPDFIPGATNVVWTGADNGTMVSIATPTGVQRIVGCQVVGMALIAGTFPFTTAAATGISISSLAFGRLDVTTFEFKSFHVNMQVTSGLLEDCNNEGNEIRIVFRALSNAGVVLTLGGTNGVGNTTMNHFSYIGGQYFNGMVVDWEACDNNRVSFIEGFKAAGGTGTFMTFRAQRVANGEFARQNVIYWVSEQTGGGKIIVEGTDVPGGAVGGSVQNQIVFFDYGDDMPDIETGAGTSFWYGSDTQPVGKNFQNISPSITAGFGVTVDTSRISDVWGVATSSGAGTQTVSVVSSGNTPVNGVQNVVVTPLGNTPGALCSVFNFTLNSFDLATSVAGEFFWRAVVI